LPTNTIIIPFRHAAHIPLCLTSLEVCGDIDQHKIILAQHGGMLYDFNRDDLRLKHWYICAQGPFHFSKLINGAVKRARTEWVTFLRHDVLIPADFIARLESAQSEIDAARYYFPIRYLDSETTHLAESHFNSFYERIVPEPEQFRRGCETYKQCLIGTDCFCVQTASYVALGGYDERFHSRSLAGIDFGRRWNNAYGSPVCLDCHLFHRWHRSSFYDENSTREKFEQAVFKEKEKQAFPPLAITGQWGIFEQSETTEGR
jgi:hypothetical protein